VQPAGGPALLLYLKEKRGVGNKTYNNYRGYFSIIFNFYISSQELPIKNPITKVEALTVEASELHLPFSNAQLSSIQETLLAKGDKQLLLFISFIYYTFARPAEEVRLLQVKDIREKTIFIPSKRAKNNKGEHITIHQDLEALIRSTAYANTQGLLRLHRRPEAGAKCRPG
jgi:integrase